MVRSAQPDCDRRQAAFHIANRLKTVLIAAPPRHWQSEVGGYGFAANDLPRAAPMSGNRSRF